jgi:hypothetical protein
MTQYPQRRRVDSQPNRASLGVQLAKSASKEIRTRIHRSCRLLLGRMPSPPVGDPRAASGILAQPYSTFRLSWDYSVGQQRGASCANHWTQLKNCHQTATALGAPTMLHVRCADSVAACRQCEAPRNPPVACLRRTTVSVCY